MVVCQVTDRGRAARPRRGGLTLEQARALENDELIHIWGGDPIADRQLELRDGGGRLVRSVLASSAPSGRRAGRQGSWMLAVYATPDTVGFVNQDSGVAVSTDVPIDPEMVEVLDRLDHAGRVVAWDSPPSPAAKPVPACRARHPHPIDDPHDPSWPWWLHRIAVSDVPLP